jgi:tetratricopeptide (TPR) repeat protein
MVRERLAMAASVLAAAVAATAWGSMRELTADLVLSRAAMRAAGGEWPAPTADISDIDPLISSDAVYLDRAAAIFLNRLRPGFDPDAYRSAMGLLRRARAANPFDPYVLLHLIDAETLAMLARRTTLPAPDVADAAARVLAIDRNNATVHETLARFRLAAGALSPALDHIQTAERLRPLRPGLRLLEGDIRRAKGDKVGSLDAYRTETTMHEGTDAVWLEAERKLTAALIERGDYDEARREAQRLLSRAPADTFGQRLLAALPR